MKACYEFGYIQGYKKSSITFAMSAYRLIQTNIRIRDITHQILQIQDKARVYAKFWRNVRGRCVESYSDLTLMNLSMHCENSHMQWNARNKILMVLFCIHIYVFLNPKPS